MIIAPQGLYWMLGGFLLFRFFDAVKPWPISWFDKHVHGGFGIMLDDVIAGIISLCCLLVIHNYLI
jgi:phosphatidylglycerophosphatase A